MSLQHIANHLAQQGRGNDKMLVHMTPSEVAGLRSLAQAKGGDLTVNPHTGLPEAGALDDILKAAAPIALGALLGPAGYGLSAGWAGAAVGGIMTLATGSLSRGLMAGLGAYGGADLMGGLSSAGVQAAAPEALASAEQGLAAGLSTDVGSEAYKNYLVENPGALGESVKAGLNNISPMDRISGGFNAVTASPDAAMNFAKNHWQAGLAATAPIMADKGVQTTTAAPTNTGYIRQKIYDPVTHRTIDLEPVKASEWGSRKFSDIYQQPTATAATGGIVALAQGGVANFDGATGSDVSTSTPTSNNDWTYDGLQGGILLAPGTVSAPTISDQQIKDAIANIQAQGGGDNEIALAMNKYGVGINRVANVTGLDASQIQQRYDTGIKNDINTWLAANPTASDATIYNAMVDNNITARQMAGVTGGSLTGEGGIQDRYNLAHDVNVEGQVVGLAPEKNTLGSAYDQTWAAYMDTHKDASGAVDPVTVKEIARTTGLSDDEIAKRYAAAEAALHPKITPTPTGTTPTPTPSGTPTPTPSGTPTPSPTPTPSGTPTPTPSVTPGGTLLPTATTYVDPTTKILKGFGDYGSGNTTGTDYLGNTVSIATPGDIITNQDNTRTIVANEPGRPYGGFTGIDQVKSAYTAGGGSLGYVNPVPKDMADFTAKFDTQSGGSRAAYDYLMGKSPYPITPYTPTGEIAKPYQSSVMGIPMGAKYTVSQPYLFDPKTRTYKPNPDYDPNFNATKDYINEPQVGLSKNTNNLLGYKDLGNGVIGIPNADGTFTGTDGKKYDASGKLIDTTVSSGSSSTNSSGGGGATGDAKGGVIYAAMGGQMYSSGGIGTLGSYSDGGRLLRGPGDGVSDSIPATIGSGQPARLADGEFVVPARIVSELGNGSTEAGARQLYKMMDRVQNARRKTVGSNKVATNTRAGKYLPV